MPYSHYPQPFKPTPTHVSTGTLEKALGNRDKVVLGSVFGVVETSPTKIARPATVVQQKPQKVLGYTQVEVPVRPGQTVVVEVSFGPRRGNDVRTTQETTWLGHQNAPAKERKMMFSVEIRPRHRSFVVIRFGQIEDNKIRFDWFIRFFRSPQ